MTETSVYGGRVIDGSLQSAVQEYRHPSGASVLVVGCVHMAEPDYYTAIRTIVDEAEASGATIYLEGTSFGVDLRVRSDEEADAIKASRDALQVQHEKIPALFELPWIHQDHSDLAPYPETWKPSDALELDMVRLVGPANAIGLAPSAGMYEYFRQLKDTHGAGSIAYRVYKRKFAKAYQKSCCQTATTAGRGKNTRVTNG